MTSPLSPKNAADITVVIPCLNEEDTLGKCLTKLETVAKNEKFKIEVIVADNGSQDRSIDIALEFNAKVVHVENKGYGAALMGGIKEAKAPLILMADADDSYDFLEVPKFFQKINEGFDLVQGCRLPRGGGNIEKKAMPWSHRYIGNPLFTFLVRNWFNAPINDVYCGMRAFKKTFYDTVKMRCTGMEFATEMIIKASNVGAKIAEVPITLYKDGRVQHPPHLRTIRDGWKTLQFLLLCAPSKLFLIPGLFMALLGFFGGFAGYFGSSLGSATFGAHTMLGSSLLIIGGCQAVLMHNLSLDLSRKIGMTLTYSSSIVQELITSRGVKISIILLISGLLLWAKIFISWYSIDFGVLEYARTMKIVIPAATLISLSFQFFIFSIFRSWMRVVMQN